MTDTVTVRVVVLALALVTLTALGGIIWLASVGAEPSLIALVSAAMNTALGALAAVLVSTRSTPVVDEAIPSEQD